jgi:hypothetical protein
VAFRHSREVTVVVEQHGEARGAERFRISIDHHRDRGRLLAATLDEHGDDTERGDERRTRQNTGSTLSS